MLLNDKVAFVTGAGSGIGRSIALLFSQEGARIVAADVNVEAAQSTVDMIAGQDGLAMAVACDVSKSEDVQRAVDAAMSEFGRIDILCNDAGIGSTQTVVDTPEELWEQVFAVNVRGIYLCCKQIIPYMVEAGNGVIVNMASVAGMVGLKNRAAYCASKGAVIALTRSIAVDYVQQGIRCNCICPGTVDSPWVGRLLAAAPDPKAERATLTARQPMGRLGMPDEIAQAALYLASEHAAFVTGSELVIDGGLTAQ